MLRGTTIAGLIAIAVACAPTVKRTASGPADALAELWIDPGSNPRDLLDGPRGAMREAVHPDVDGRYRILERDTRGFSITYRVRDARGREWNVKVGPESQTEVVTSRIVWAVGYHELPSYFVERWIGVDDRARGSQFGGARFRPRDVGLKSAGEWSWQQNPFVGTRPYGGLLALMLILNSTDLKNANNGLYDVVGEPREQASRWYVVKDLGASLGETGRFDPRRGNVEAFEREPFLLSRDARRLRFGYAGRHKELLQAIAADDVRWVCRRLQALTDRQWHDAFRAGGFDRDTSERYIARIHAKIDEGLRLE